MSRLLVVLGLALLVWVFACGSPNEEQPAQASDPRVDAAWLDDLGPALQVARRDGKDVLVNFTGSDWCSWCIKLHDEAFGRSEFVDAVSADFVLVALDYPRNGGAVWNAMAEDLRARNAREAKAFGIRGYPTVMLLTPEGVAYARTGYQRGGATAYAQHVDGLRRSPARAAVQQQLSLLRQVDGAREARVAAGYALLESTAAAGRDDLLEVLAELDPEDSRGLQSAAALGR